MTTSDIQAVGAAITYTRRHSLYQKSARILCSAMAYRWSGGTTGTTTEDVAASLGFTDAVIKLAHYATDAVAEATGHQRYRDIGDPADAWPDARDTWAEAERQFALGWNPGEELR